VSQTVPTMPLRDLLKKKEKLEIPSASAPEQDVRPPPKITFVRSDTNTEEVISPPSFSNSASSSQPSTPADGSPDLFRRLSRFKPRSRSSTEIERTSPQTKERPTPHKRISQRLGLQKRDQSSTHVPQDLPDLEPAQAGGDEGAWEKRATMLAKENDKNRSHPASPEASTIALPAGGSRTGRDGPGKAASKNSDNDIQEAIRLHEEGDLEKSTCMFGRLADPKGENNALSQVLYGLALRLV
jgi:hypothetical protein